MNKQVPREPALLPRPIQVAVAESGESGEALKATRVPKVSTSHQLYRVNYLA
jgi:hypothetical protein